MRDRSLTLPQAAADTGQRLSDRTGSPFSGAILAITVCAAVAEGLARILAGVEGAPVAILTFIAGSVLTLQALRSSYPHREFGAANAVTLLRLALVSGLAGVLAGSADTTPLAAWGVPAIAAAALVLDGLDGWLARRTRLVSDFGARFDMEVDCALALVLALTALSEGKAGAWVLALGVARYAFWAAARVLPWLGGPLPPRWSRKAVCVVQIAIMIALVLPPVGGALATAMAASAIALVAWSFAVDVRHLYGAAG